MARRTIGLVGLGKVAIDLHIPSIADTGLFDLVAVVSRRGIGLPGVPTFPTQEAMLAAFPGLDAVVNCAPPAGRHRATVAALRAGQHVLVEKPPTASVAELADMSRVATETGRVLFAAWHAQLNKAVEAARLRLAGAAVRRVVVTWKEDVRHWHPGQDWVWEPGGFGVFDPAINALSILTRILPVPFFVVDADLAFPSNRAMPIAAAVTFRADGVEQFSADFDWRQEGEQTWSIAITLEGGTRLDLTRGGTRLAIDGVPTVEPTYPDYGHIYREIYRRFAGLIDGGTSDVDPAPLRVVADAFLAGRRRVVPPFHW